HPVAALALPLPPRDRSEHLRGLAADCLRALGVVPEAGGGGLLVQLGRTPLEPGEVKGASRARRRARRGPGHDRAAWSARGRRSPARSPSTWVHTIAERSRRGESCFRLDRPSATVFRNGREEAGVKVKFFAVAMHERPRGSPLSEHLTELVNRYLAEHPSIEVVQTHVNTAVLPPEEGGGVFRDSPASIVVVLALFYRG